MMFLLLAPYSLERTCIVLDLILEDMYYDVTGFHLQDSTCNIEYGKTKDLQFKTA